MSGAFSARLSFLASLSRIGASLKGVPSGEVVRLDGEFWRRSLGLLGIGAGVVPGILDDEGLKVGGGFANRSFPGFPGGVVAGPEVGAVGIGETPFSRLSLPLPLSGAIPGLANVVGAVVAAG